MSWEPTSVGLNCSVGPAAMLDGIERMVEHTRRPVSAQPNAGLPRAVDDRRIYLASPDYMGSYARRMIQAGARFVGGCCGTTPDHIRKIHAYVSSLQPRLVAADVSARAREPIGVAAAPLAERSRLGRKAGPARVGEYGRNRAPKGVECRGDDRAVPVAAGGGGRCGQRARQRPGPEPHGRATRGPDRPA